MNRFNHTPRKPDVTLVEVVVVAESDRMIHVVDDIGKHHMLQKEYCLKEDGTWPKDFEPHKKVKLKVMSWLATKEKLTPNKESIAA